MRGIIDWFWNALFLDFYLDKDWTLKFKILNFLSGDVLRQYLSIIRSQLINHEEYAKKFGNLEVADIYARRAKASVDVMWNYYRK